MIADFEFCVGLQILDFGQAGGRDCRFWILGEGFGERFQILNFVWDGGRDCRFEFWGGWRE